MSFNGTPLQAIKYAIDKLSAGDPEGFLRRWIEGEAHLWSDFTEFCAENPDEPEIKAPDGTVRKAHYGTGKQPWDIIVEQGWGAAFAAGNVLKYVRRAALKHGEDDIAKARWYWARIWELAEAAAQHAPHEHAFPGRPGYVLNQLRGLLTDSELALLRRE